MQLSKSIPIRLLTHNIRYASDSPFEGEEKWSVRSPRIISELRFHTAHCSASFICLQEVLHHQLLDILSNLNDDDKNTWAYIGVGRDDGKEAGEYSPIFYQPAIWVLQFYKTVWLSETPDRPSRGWDAASTRILTIGKFQHRESGKKIVAMNTHLDDQGSQSRLEAAKLILEQVFNMTDATHDSRSCPVFLAGDFNSEPTEEAYKTITGEGSPFSDLHQIVPDKRMYGDYNTFTGFGFESEPPKRIDFLFVNYRPPKYTSQAECDATPWHIVGYGVLANRFEDGIYSSDHRAVVGDLLLG